MAAPAVTKNLQALGNYRIAQVLGFNGVLATFKGFEAESQLPAAIVAVHQSSLRDARIWEAARHEFEPLVNQPASRLCQPFACGAEAGHYWAAYEWQVGSHLGIVVRDNGLPAPSQSFFWMSELADALATLHRRGTVHRVISPSSVFVNDFYQVKLLHSGWGRVVQAAEGGLLNPAMSSVLPFVSPEIATGRGCDESSDVYSIGAVLYFLLSGMPPFWHDEPSELAHAIANQPPDFGGLEELVGREGYDLLDELLQKAPDDRPLNLPALADRLRSIAARLQAADSPAEEPPAGATQLDVPATVVSVAAPVAAAAPSAPANPVPPPAAAAAKPAQGFSPPPNLYAQPQQARSHEPAQAEPAAEKAAKAPAQALKEAAAAAGKLQEKLKITPQQMKLAGIAVGGLVGALLVVTVAAKLLLGGGSEDDVADAEPPPPAKNAGPAKPSAADIAAYDKTMDRLRATGQYMVGYQKLNGEWPKTVDELRGADLGVKDEEVEDAWKRRFEVREGGFAVSAGKDGKWDTGDDVWVDATKNEIGGGLEARN